MAFRQKHGTIGLVVITMICFSIYVWPAVSATPDPVNISWYVADALSAPVDGANLTIYWAASLSGPFTKMPYDDGAGTYILDRIANARQNPITTGYWNPDHPHGMAVCDVHPKGGINGLYFYIRVDHGTYSWYWPVASSYKPGDPSWVPIVSSGSPSGYAAAGPSIGNGVTTAYPTQQPLVQQYYLIVQTDPSGITTIPGQGWYINDTYANLTAPLYVPNTTGLNGERNKFVNWTVDGNFVAGNAITVQMNANHTATAHYVKQYLLTVLTDPSGLTPQPARNPSGEAGPANGWWYDAATGVMLTAQTVTGYAFSYWDVDGTSQGSLVNPITVTINTNHTATAHYTPTAPLYYLTVFSPYGSPTPTNGSYASGAMITAFVTSPWPGPPGTRYVCTGWTGTGSVPPSGVTSSVNFTITQNSSITWNWKTQYYLTVSSPYGTTGGEEWNDSGATAYATLDTGVIDQGNGTRRVFTNWSGDASGTNYAQSDPIQMNAPKTAIANWKTQYRLTVRTLGLGTYVTNVYNDTTILGSATDASPYIGWFDEGSLILVDIDSPIIDGSKRFMFTQWSGDAAGTNRPASVTMTTVKDVTANYQLQYLLKVFTNPSGLSPQPTRNPAGQAGPADGWWYDAATGVTLTAQTVTGYTFSYWDVDGTSQGSLVNPITVTMNTNHTATAYYVQALSVTISPVSARIKIGESATFTSSVSGGSQPYSYQWYLNGSAVSGATSSTWTFAPTFLQPIGNYTVYLIVTDSLAHSAQSNPAIVTVAPALTVQISPLSASILVGQPITITATNVSGGYPPYSYQWYLDGNPVPGATSSSWTFTPTAPGIYYVYLKVTDTTNNTAQSDTARIVVTSGLVGGYSVTLSKGTSTSQAALYVMLFTFFGTVLCLKRRKRKCSR